MFDKDITIANKWYNKEKKSNEYKVHHLKGFWSSSNGISISDTALVKSDNLIVRILLEEKGYVNPKEFQKEGKGWTLKNDDYLIKGIIDNISTITEIKEDYECMKITNISIKDYGSIDMQHYEISGE